MKDFKTLKVEQGGPGVLVVTLNRPQEYNAIDATMHQELVDFAYEIRELGDLGAIVITGEGKGFCGGGSMDLIGQVRDADFRAANRQLEQGISLIRDYLAIRPPVITAMNGSATGLGATIALLGDFIVMAENAKIADTHVKVGLVAGDGGTLLWPARIGVARAKEFLLSGDFVDAPTALQMGLVNRVVPADQVLPTALEWAQKLADGARHAIAYTKQAMNAELLRQAAHQMPLALALEGRTFHEPDVTEGITSFVERRPAKFPSTEPEK